MSAERFEWTPDTTVVAEQREIAVYTNPDGGVVLRERGWPDEDNIIVMSTHRAARDVALAILAIVGNGE